MISLTLFALAVLWIAVLHQYPWLFAREPRRRSVIPRYHYDVCGTGELPTWRRKDPEWSRKTVRSR
jgi:hypothetical protein